MLSNYLKISWRNLFRNKGFSASNIVSLTIGMTCAIFILLWVQDEVSYDKFHKNYDNIYQVMANRDFENTIFTDQNMVFPLAASLEKAIPQIENAVVATYAQKHILTYGNNKLVKTGYTVSANYFDMFLWNFIKGNAATALMDPSSIVLTQSAAKVFFGEEDPINKTLNINNENNLKVTAIVADPPSNSSFQFDFVRPFNYSDPNVKRVMNRWVGSSWSVYVQMTPGANIELLNKNINAVQKQNNPGDHVSTYFTFPMNRWRLYSEFKDGVNVGGMIEYVKLFSIIAVIIVLIACINFMNLSTARSARRMKEVGIRKTLGSGKKQLVLQFFFESTLFTVIAFILSVALVYLLLPSFNILVSKQLSLGAVLPSFWPISLGMVLLTGIIAGSYPALYLSSFNPVKVLKGTFLAGKNAALPRRVLVVGQFTISMLLISATIIVYQQIQHIKDREMGYNSDNLVMIPSSPDINKNYTVIKGELLKTGMINSVTRASAPITEIGWRDFMPDWNGKPADANIIVTALSADVDFTKTTGIKLLHGKDFSGLPSDSSSMILNKAAADIMGIENPVGMSMRKYGKQFTVVGLTDNVIMESPYKPVEPMIVFYEGNSSDMLNFRLNEGVIPQKALQAAKTIFEKYNPAFPFEYQFADEEFEKKFLGEELIGKLTNIFAGLAILICCIGLAGLASFTIERRVREIGIRKVLGSTVQQLLMLISREFLWLVLIAFIISVPLAWWFMNSWLQNYTYRMVISPWIFALVGVVILLLTLAIVSLNTVRAALSNPVKSLRSE